MRKIGILTGGGDCPGLNAVILLALLKMAPKQEWKFSVFATAGAVR